MFCSENSLLRAMHLPNFSKQIISPSLSVNRMPRRQLKPIPRREQVQRQQLHQISRKTPQSTPSKVLKSRIVMTVYLPTSQSSLSLLAWSYSWLSPIHTGTPSSKTPPTTKSYSHVRRTIRTERDDLARGKPSRGNVSRRNSRGVKPFVCIIGRTITEIVV